MESNVITGLVFTVTVTAFVSAHPRISVPTMVYVVVVVGLAKVLSHVAQDIVPDGYHKYVLDPRASKLVESPTHIAVGRAVTLTVAGVSIVTVTVAESVQPELLVPTTL